MVKRSTLSLHQHVVITRDAQGGKHYDRSARDFDVMANGMARGRLIGRPDGPLGSFTWSIVDAYGALAPLAGHTWTGRAQMAPVLTAMRAEVRRSENVRPG